jgi:6-pyruvoyltetrahydropterin/6-carboxytetrahydropterin synthase
MYELEKTFSISAAHYLKLDYDSPCAALHGHNWRITVFLRSETLNENGMIMDFSEIKRRIHARLDHAVLNDVLDFNPTAENLAHWICHELAPFAYRVDVCESEGNTARYYNDAALSALMQSK